MKSKHPRIARFRAQYEDTDGIVNQETWFQYWTRMTGNGTWVDVWFVQATAWYMQLDIWIIATSNTENSPYIEINGNIEDDTRPCNGPIITLGTKSNCHYQSLLPTEMFHLDFHQTEHCQSETLKEPKKPVVNAEASTTSPQTKVHSDQENAGQPLEPNDDLPLIFESSGKILTFLRMSDDYVMKCPLCKTETKYIVRHIGSNTYCKNQISKEEFKSQFQLYKKEKANKDHANRQRAWRERQRAQDAENYGNHQSYIGTNRKQRS